MLHYMYIILHYLPSSYLFSVPGEVHLYFAVLSQLPVLAEFPLHPAPQDIPLTELQVLTGNQPLLAANTVKKKYMHDCTPSINYYIIHILMITTVKIDT